MNQRVDMELEYSSIQIQKGPTGGEFVRGQKQQDIPLWDTEELTSGENKRLFGVSKTYQGSGPSSGTTKTIVERNWPGSGGSLPTPREFAIHSISAEVLSAADDGGNPSMADFFDVRAWAVLHFLQHRTTIWSLPLSQLGGPGLTGIANAAATGGWLNLGSAHPADVHDLQMAIAVGSGMPVKAMIQTTSDFAPDDAMRVRVRFDGYSYKSLG